MIEEILVHKLDENGVEIWNYPARTLRRTPEYIRLEARFDRDQVSLGSLMLCPGDRFVETFYFERWYNIFEIFDRDIGSFKGWYCNITRPAWMDARDLYAEDLALDLVVLPAGEHLVLDEDEFEELEISQEDRLQAVRALHLLQSQAQERSGHFAAAPR